MRGEHLLSNASTKLIGDVIYVESEPFGSGNGKIEDVWSIRNSGIVGPFSALLKHVCPKTDPQPFVSSSF